MPKRGLSCCAHIKRAYVFCFKELWFFSQKHFALCSLALNPKGCSLPYSYKQIKRAQLGSFYLPKRGLEPLRISPYAPETHVSTIPPLRHNLILSSYIQFSRIFLCTQWRMLVQDQPSRKT